MQTSKDEGTLIAHVSRNDCKNLSLADMLYRFFSDERKMYSLPEDSLACINEIKYAMDSYFAKRAELYRENKGQRPGRFVKELILHAKGKYLFRTAFTAYFICTDPMNLLKENSELRREIELGIEEFLR